MIALKNKVENLRDELSELIGQEKVLTQQITVENSILSTLKIDYSDMKKAVEVLDFIQKSSNEMVKSKFEELVTNFIQFVTEDESYQFLVEFGKKGNIPIAEFKLKSPSSGEEFLPINECSGGGIIDIVSIALRITVMQFLDVEPLLMLDESLKGLSENYQAKAVEFIKMLTTDLDYQVIMITHRQLVKDCFDNLIEIGKE